MLELNSISHAFGANVVLRDFQLKLDSGDRCVIRGTNGTGKSTLLKIIAGLLTPNAGTVTRPPGRIGYLAPDLVLYHDLTLLENLDFFASVRGLARGDANLDLLKLVGLADRVHEAAGNMSTGLGQRLKLAYALQGKPQVLLLDEPTSNLDAAGRETVERVVLESNPDLVIWTSHTPLYESWTNREVTLG